MASGFTIVLRVASVSFDGKKILAAVERGKRRAQVGTAAFVQRKAKSLLRRRKKSSERGQPPSIHTSVKPNLKTILFAHDRQLNDYVIGPILLNKHQYEGNFPVKGTVPRVLEEGGTVGIREKQRWPGGPWGPMFTTRKLRPGEAFRVRRATYAPRPFMGPALEQGSAEYLKRFGGVVF